MTRYRTDPPLASRVYTLLSVAQDSAVRVAAGYRASSGACAVDHAAAVGASAVDHAAAVGASAAVLTDAFPLEATLFDSPRHGDPADPLWSADTPVSVAAGDSVGRAVAARQRRIQRDASSLGAGAPTLARPPRYDSFTRAPT